MRDVDAASAAEYRSTDPDLFTIRGGLPVLLASHCPVDRETFYPCRWVCPICLGPVEGVELAGTGTLYSFTYVAQAVYGEAVSRPEGFTMGQIDLDEGVRLQAILAGERDSWTIGQRVRAILAPIESADPATDSCPLALYEFAADNRNGAAR